MSGMIGASSDHTSAGRRELLKLGLLGGLGLGLHELAGCAAGDRRREGSAAAPRSPLVCSPLERVRVGFVGVGGMGSWHVENLLKIDGVELRAICDIVPEKVERMQQRVVEAGQPRPAGFSRGPRDFERMCERQELDVVYTATPWEWHVPVCVAALRSGKHAATEVPAATTIEECWQLVEHAEKYQRHCVMLENCCYDRAELMCLMMVRKGVLGEVLHGECGYLHDLRAIKFSTDGEGLWRRAHSQRRNANLYPTHGIGPIAQCMNINRGDQFDYLVSMSGPSRGLQNWQNDHLAADDPRRGERYRLGDVNLALIQTKQGRTIYLVHDTNLPRPYSRIHIVQGTRGIFEKWPERVHVEGRSPGHQWEKLDAYADEFEHPLWRSQAVKQMSGGHGGMDFLENYRLVQCLMRGEPTDMNVYDAAAWSCLTEATERSVAGRSRPIDIPDFTRGRWQHWPPLDPAQQGAGSAGGTGVALAGIRDGSRAARGIMV